MNDDARTKFMETSWGPRFGYIQLAKIERPLGFECCQVIAVGPITTRCWVCNEHTGAYLERIPITRDIKRTNSYLGQAHGPGEYSHLAHP